MAFQSGRTDYKKIMRLENNCLKQLKSSYAMAKKQGPFSDKGRDMLLMAEDIRKEYETMGTPLVTAVAGSNSSAFEDIIPDDLIEDINTGKLKGLGLFRTEADGSYPVAVCIYKQLVLPEELNEKSIIDMRWIYLEQRPDEKNIADQLIAEMALLVIKKDASALTVGIRRSEYTESLSRTFDEWGFDVSEGIDSGFRCRLGDIDNIKNIRENANDATSLGTLTGPEQSELIKRYLKLSDQMELLEYISRIPGYYEGDVSCFVGTPKEPAGLMLVHKKPSGILVGEYFDRNPESGSSVLKLVSCCIDNAMMKYNRKTEITFFAESEELEEFLDRMIPKQRAIPMIEAVLNS